LGLAESLGLLAATGALGWAGAWLSVGRHLALLESYLDK
jgi:hypothetical protein